MTAKVHRLGEYQKSTNTPEATKAKPVNQDMSTDRVIIEPKEGDDMADEWMRDLIKKMDDDQKRSEERLQKSINESNERHEQSISQIKLLLEQISEDNKQSKKDNQEILRQTMWWTIGTLISIVGLAIATIIGLIQIAQALG